MRRYKVSYFIGQAFRGMWRNGMMSVAAVIVLFSCLVVMGCFTMLVMNINSSLKDIDDLNRIYVFVDSNVDYKEGDTVKLADAPKSKNTSSSFLGWSTDPKSEEPEYRSLANYTVNPEDSVGGAVTFYAIWGGERKYDSYTVKYNSYGKKTENELPESAVCQAGDEITFPDDPVPFFSADEFLGWSLEAGAKKGTYSAGDTYKIKAEDAVGGAITFYAVWNQESTFDSFDIVYEMNGEDVESVPNDASVRLSSVKSKLEMIDVITSTEFISKEETLEAEKENFVDYPGLLQLLDNMKSDDNPYPDTYVLSYEEKASVNDIEQELSVLESRGTITGYKCRVDIANRITNLKNGIVLVFSWFMIILFVVSIFVIINTIKLALTARSHEIMVMRYIGATKTFISLPFHMEGIVIGLLSGCIAFFIDWGVYHYIETNVQVIQMIEPIPFSSLRTIMLVGSLIVGAVMGYIGSAISIRKNLKA